MPTHEKRRNPLFANTDREQTIAEEQAPTQEIPTTQDPPVREPVAALPSRPQQEKEDPLLYQSQPSAEYLMRPFDRQRDKGAVNGNPYLLGAIDAIGKLARKDKYEMFDEMMLDYIERYRTLLESRPDVVRLCEEKYRKKHNL